MNAARATPYGRVIVGPAEELYPLAVALATERFAAAKSPAFTWALSGGSTPQAWYRWCVARNALSPDVVASVHFTVSDERHVPIESPQSNFGIAERLLLDPISVPGEHRHAWPVSQTPARCAEEYGKSMVRLSQGGPAYDVCMLGMGDDAHTASFFPGSPLLQHDGGRYFAAVDAGERGWRLTVTPAGLGTCGLILVMVIGASKAPAFKQVMAGDHRPLATPAQILKTCADRVVWLVDGAAAAGIGG